MGIISNVLVGFVAILELLFLVLEMFLWNTPPVMKAFRFSKEFADQSFSLAKNQGLYNGFLAAGLIWSLIVDDEAVVLQFKIFFLGCVLIAGIYGGITANKRILIVQALPAFVALVAVLAARY